MPGGFSMLTERATSKYVIKANAKFRWLYKRIKKSAWNKSWRGFFIFQFLEFDRKVVEKTQLFRIFSMTRSCEALQFKWKFQSLMQTFVANIYFLFFSFFFTFDRRSRCSCSRSVQWKSLLSHVAKKLSRKFSGVAHVFSKNTGTQNCSRYWFLYIE